MAKLLHEVWRCGGAFPGLTMCLAGPMGDQARSMLQPDTRLLQVFVAGSYFEACTIYHRIVGFGLYHSDWEALDSQPYPEEWAAIQRADGAA